MFNRIILNYWRIYFFCEFKWFRWILDPLLKVLLLILTKEKYVVSGLRKKLRNCKFFQTLSHINIFIAVLHIKSCSASRRQ